MATTPTHRHKKRGSEYVLIGYGKMQAGQNWQVLCAPEGSKGLSFYPKAEILRADMREVAIYHSAADPTEIWVRPREEFEDGRFEEIVQVFPAISE